MFEWPNFGCELDVPSHTILLALAGSRSYGTEHPLSDWDYAGVLVPPLNFLWGPYRNFKTTSWKDGEETGRFSPVVGQAELGREGRIRGINHFFFEAKKCNPNVIEALWVDEQHLVHITPEGEMLREHRELFLNQGAARSFGGYAMSQLKRMQLHYGYGHSGRPDVPSRTQFGLPEIPAIRLDQQGAADAFVNKYMYQVAPWLQGRKNDERAAFWEAVMNIVAIVCAEPDRAYDPMTDNWHEIEQTTAWTVAEQIGFKGDFIEYLKLEKKYAQLVKKQKDYDNWIKNRNPVRHELEAKYGYDCKHAMHLVRILRMGKELLTTGQLTVARPDAEELLEIRDGRWEYDRVIEHANSELEIIYQLARSEDCVLPKLPDQQALEVLYYNVVTAFYYRNNYL